MKLTRAQTKTLRRLSDLADGAHPKTWWTVIFIGIGSASSLSALAGLGLVEIDRRGSNRSGYRITEAGKAALEGGE